MMERPNGNKGNHAIATQTRYEEKLGISVEITYSHHTDINTMRH